MDVSLNFISRFHNLDGDLVSERKKNFGKLLSIPDLSVDKQVRDKIVNELKPQTYQENLFYLDILIYFKRSDKLIELLIEGNEIFAKKILKQLWLFDETFETITAQMLVDFLPNLSFTIRNKFLTNISKCWADEKMNALHDALLSMYGLAVTIPILHTCTPRKIKAVLRENDIQLRPRQVIELYKKSEEIFEFYLDYFKALSRSIYGDPKVVKYIAVKNPAFLLELWNNKKIVMVAVGRKITKSIINIAKDDIANNVEKYYNILNKDVLVRTFGAEGKKLLVQMFPQIIKNTSNYVINLFKFYPKKNRWGMFFEAYHKTFNGCNCIAILLNLTPKIKLLHPPPDVIYKWAEIHYDQQQHNYMEFLKYFPTDKAITLVKQKINATLNVNTKLNLLKVLMTNFHENNDLTAFEKVLEYIDTRHSNEHPAITNSILKLIENCFNLDDLNEAHWKYINKQIDRLRDQNECKGLYIGKLIDYYLKFLIKNEIDLTDTLCICLEDIVEENLHHTFKINDPFCERIIFLRLCGMFPENEYYRKRADCFIHQVLNFNLDNPNYCINLTEFPHFLSEIEFIFHNSYNVNDNNSFLISKVIVYNDTFPEYAFPIGKDTIFDVLSVILIEEISNCWFEEVLTKCVLIRNRTEFGKDLLDFYLETNVYDNSEIVLWFLKNEPRTIVPYFDLIMENSFKYHYIVLLGKSVRQYSHLNLDSLVKHYYLHKLDEITERDELNSVVLALSFLMTTEEFVQLIEDKFLPSERILDVNDTQMRFLYQLHCCIPKFLGNINEPCKTLPTVMKFMNSYYSKEMLQALYSIFYRSPERLLYSCIERLILEDVFTCKHALILSSEIFDEAYVVYIIDRVNERYLSMQKFLFSVTFKYFLKNPSERMFAVIKYSMFNIDKTDTKSLDILKNAIVSRGYRTRYIMKCWNFFENLELPRYQLNNYLQRFLISIVTNICPVSNLSTQFLTYIIRRYFIGEDKFYINYFECFVIIVLKDRMWEGDDYINYIFSIIFKDRNFVSNKFFRPFCRAALKREIHINCVLSFSAFWHQHFDLTFLKGRIAVMLVLYRMEHTEAEGFAIAIVDYMNELIHHYTPYILHTYRSELVYVFDTMKKVEIYELCLAILNYNIDVNTCSLIYEVLNMMDMDRIHETDSQEVRNLYENLMGILESVNIRFIIDVGVYNSALLIHN